MKRNQLKKTSLTQKRLLRDVVAVAAVVGVSVLGAYLLIVSHAASPYTSIEAESGQLGGVAKTVTGTSLASGGAYVEFGTASSTDVGVHISNGQLVTASGQSTQLRGVDVSGTEDACIQDRGFAWGKLDAAEAAGIASWHVNVVRVPLNEDCWLGINGAPAAYSGANYQNAIKQWITNLNNAGIVAILDLHWAAPGTYPANQQWPMADEDHSPTFWTQVATAYKHSPGIIFDLFNEPFMGSVSPTTANWSCWLNGCSYTYADATINGVANSSATYTTAGMQQLVNDVRVTGATQPIMLGGLRWASDPCGLDDSGGNGGSCMWVANKPTDPQNQLLASFHNYFGNCTDSACWNEQLQGLSAAKVPLFTGEFGEEDCSTDKIDAYMNWADQNNVSYLAWSWEPYIGSLTQCAPSPATGDGMNYQLISQWDGTPNDVAPEGAAIKAHLAQLAAEGN